jgi:1,4-dihydroxy-2-naphthoate octaprenyltransferase
MIKKVLSILKPINTLLILLTYFLGIGIAHYLGFPQRINALWNGLILIIAFHTGSIFLGKYFELYFFPNSDYSAEEKRNPIKYQQEKNLRILFLLIGVACLALCMIPLFAFLFTDVLIISNLILIILTFFIISIVEIFPDQVSNAGLLEFLQALYFANLIPSIAFSLQSNSIHRLLFLLTFPLFFLFLALFIAFSLPKVGNNTETWCHSLISRIGPILSLKIHNLLILLAYMTLLSGRMLDLPWKLIWPVLITMPIGLIQIWQVNRILKGHKPNFTSLIFTAIASAGFATYFMMLSLLLN